MERRLIETSTGVLEVFIAGAIAPGPFVCAAHPAGVFAESAADLHGPALLVSPMPVSPEMRAAMPLLWTLDFRKSLQQIRTPTLVIGGSSDPIVPLSHVRSLHEAIAGSKCLIVEGAGHVPTTARRSEVASTVKTFLRDCAT